MKLGAICVILVWECRGRVLGKVSKLYVVDCNRILAKVVDNSVQSWSRGSNVVYSSMILILPCLVVQMMNYKLICKLICLVMMLNLCVCKIVMKNSKLVMLVVLVCNLLQMDYHNSTPPINAHHLRVLKRWISPWIN